MLYVWNLSTIIAFQYESHNSAEIGFISVVSRQDDGVLLCRNHVWQTGILFMSSPLEGIESRDDT